MSAGKPTALGGSRPMLAGGPVGVPISADQGYALQYPPGSYNFTPTKAGYWKFVGWGPGGSAAIGTDSGASGGYFEITKFLSARDAVALVVGLSPALGVGAGTTTSVTFPSGAVATATSGGLGAGAAGVATGGDVNLNGSDGVLNSSGNLGNAGLGTGGGAQNVANGGSSAPANLPFRGGLGSLVKGQTPGAGGGQSASGVGGDGMLIVYFVRP